MSNSHLALSRSQPDFPLTATLTVTGNCWVKPEGHGSRFFQLVLSKSPKTVGEAIEMATALEQPFTPRECQRHLKWAYTSASGCLEVDGQRFSNGSDEPQPKKAKAAKAVEPAAAAKAASKKIPVKKSKKVA
jgi:hypothetical protein